MAIPLKDKKKRVFGLLTVDTINDPINQKNLSQMEAEVEDEAEAEELSEDTALKRSAVGMFTNHEIQFYQVYFKAVCALLFIQLKGLNGLKLIIFSTIIFS